MGEFPHQVMLSWGVGGGLMCGGSLVTSTKVITAGHCCDGQAVEDIGVVVANYIYNATAPDEANFAIKGYHLHEEYDDWTVANDICVLDLDGEADLTSELIDVIALPEEMEEYEAGTECVCTGWEQPPTMERVPTSCRRSPYPSPRWSTAVLPMARTLSERRKFLTRRSALVWTRVAGTP